MFAILYFHRVKALSECSQFNINYVLIVYLLVNATCGEDVVRLFAMVGSNSFWQFYSPFNLTIDPSFVANYTWNIKVQQIDCSQQDNPLQGE